MKPIRREKEIKNMSKDYLSIGGSFFPKKEILSIEKIILRNSIYVSIKTQRTRFLIDFGDNEEINSKIVDDCIIAFRENLENFRKNMKN